MKDVLTISNVKKHFGGIYALQGCTLRIPHNKITALIGPNGCGKSTLFNVINHLFPAEEGTLVLDGKDITKQPAHKVAQAGISRTFQYPTLFTNLTIRDHLEMALMQNDTSLWKSLIGVSKKGQHDKRITEVLQLVGLDKDINTLGSDLSYGQRKLLDLAIAIAQPHHLIMLDEPVAGINPKLRKKIKTILKELHKQGETILVIEHDMNFIMDIADHVFVMEQGKILVEGKPKDIQNNPKVLEAYLGE